MQQPHRSDSAATPTNSGMALQPPLPTAIRRRELIRLAEKADGLRGPDELLLVYGPNSSGVGSYDVITSGTEGANDQSLLRIDPDHDKSFKGGSRRKPVKLTSNPPLKRKNGKAIGAVDAWFTSPAAVEKFLIPYYARTNGAAFAEALRAEYFADENILALIHEPPSEPERLVETTATITAQMAVALVAERISPDMSEDQWKNLLGEAIAKATEETTKKAEQIEATVLITAVRRLLGNIGVVAGEPD